AREYGAWDIEIVAEINNAPRQTREALRGAADYFRASGADVIDVGCTPGLSFPALSDVVGELIGAGMRVSVDTFDPDEIRTAVARGLMHYAVTRRTSPKGVDHRLVTVKDPAVLSFSKDELRALQAGITDPNFRVFADREGITVLNNERFIRSTDVNKLEDIF